MHRVADMDRHDMGAVIDDRQAQSLEPGIFRIAGLFLLLVTQRPVRTSDGAPKPPPRRHRWAAARW